MSQENPISVAVLDAPHAGSRQMRVCYFLTSNAYSGETPHTGFDIEARLYSNDQLVDATAVADVTCSRQEAVALIELLAKNTVTPVTLKDVVEDYTGI